MYYAGPFNAAPTPPNQANLLSRTTLERLTREIKDIMGLYNLAIAIGPNLNLVEMSWIVPKTEKECRRKRGVTGPLLPLFRLMLEE